MAKQYLDKTGLKSYTEKLKKKKEKINDYINKNINRTFDTQDIVVNLSDYDEVEVWCRNAIDLVGEEGYTCYKGIVPHGSGDPNYMMQLLIKDFINGRDGLNVRTLFVHENRISCSKAYFVRIWDGDVVENNNKLIPVYVIGIKNNGLFS